MSLFNMLPSEVKALIFSFDPTRVEVWGQVLSELKQNEKYRFRRYTGIKEVANYPAGWFDGDTFGWIDEGNYTCYDRETGTFVPEKVRIRREDGTTFTIYRW
jgi:hypothetical protein